MNIFQPIAKFFALSLTACSLLSVFDMEQYRRFHSVRRRYSQLCKDFSVAPPSKNGAPSGNSQSSYDWPQWSLQIKRTFSPRVPLAFLWNSIIADVMVAGGLLRNKATTNCIELVRNAFGENILQTISKEDCIGIPKITDHKYKTSFNRIYHCSHLAHYTEQTKKSLQLGNTVVEWGGGYGDMARIIRRLNSATTYVLIDLPELLALQYIYLYSMEGEDALHIVAPGTSIADGKINFVPVQFVRSGAVNLSADVFLSTWALTESPPADQELVVAHQFFGAEQILIASARDPNNRVAARLNENGGIRIPVPTIGEQSEYSFR